MKTILNTYQLIAINDANQSLFLDYARLYRYDHDESDLYEESLLVFDSQKQPTYVLVNEAKEVFGAISIRIMPYLENKQRARLAMFHVAIDELDYYEVLLEAVKEALVHVDHLFGFMPERKAVMAKIMPDLGFEIERFVWVLTRSDKPVSDLNLSEGYSLETLNPETDAMHWCHVRNEAFKTLKGSETPMNVEGFRAMLESQGHLPEGMLLLWHDQQVVGIVRVAHEIEEDVDYGFIGPVAVLPAYQGKGLGRTLVRAALHRSRELNLNQAMLCVNADNARAADLYLKEGFEKAVVMICYRMTL